MARRMTARLKDLTRRDDGAALVEFAITLPMMLVVFAVIVEGTRMMLAYQATIEGVRDAARYLARVVPSNVCASGGSVTGYNGQLLSIVRSNASAGSVLPSSVTVTSVSGSLSCVAGTWRVSPAPVAQVTANVSITFPFAAVFSLAGSSLGQINTSVTDRSRIFGT
jgi:Flp pilus assembly protein TadG